MIITRQWQNSFNRGSIAQTGIIPTGARFLQDTFPLQVRDIKSVVSESAGISRPVLRMTGIFQKADDRNQNGRRYPFSILKEAVDAIQEDVAQRSVMGEFDHPADAKIHLDRVSHLISRVWMEGKYVYGAAEVLTDMPCGAMLATLLRNKVQVGISSRGVGDMVTVNEGSQETQRVLDGYQFVTWDMVAEPSVTEAVMSVMESKNRKVLTRRVRASIDPQSELLRQIDMWLKRD